MKNGRKTLIYAACVVVLALAARATVKSVDEPASSQEPKPDPASALSSDNPYGAIVERNVFDLHDPPPPKEPDKPKEPPANIKLTGITTIFGNKQALFMVNEPGAAGKPPTTHSLILAEGQRAGVLEVLEIDPRARTARIKNEEIESLIHIETNKTAGGSVSAPAGGPAGAHGSPGGYQRGGYNPGNPGGGNIPPRPLRENPRGGAGLQPGYGGAGVAPQQNYSGAYGGGYNGGYGGAAAIQTPGGALNLNGTPTSAYNQTPASTLTPQQQAVPTPEEQAILIEAQRAQAQAAGSPIALILPPTPLSQGLNQQPQSSPTGPTAPTAPTPALGATGTGTLSGIYVPPTR